MTGFGRAKLEINGRIYGIDIKSVNHKYSDISIKLPRSLMHTEKIIKTEIAKHIGRGKIDVFVTFENYSEEGKKVVVNQELVKEYLSEFHKLAEEHNLDMNLSVTDITKLPDVLTLRVEDENDDVIQKELLECLSQAIQNFISMREEEGKRIKQDMEKRIDEVERNVEEISKYSSRLIEEYVVKLEDRIKELLNTNVIDEQRLAMETVIYADKCSVEEEITRLNSHIGQFRELINEKSANGKKLDFLMQEMNRETNTIGSKSGSLDITNIVINIKTELEDIREQVQNIE